MKNDVTLLCPSVLTPQEVLREAQVFHAEMFPHGAEELIFYPGCVAYEYSVIDMNRDEGWLATRVDFHKDAWISFTLFVALAR